METTTKTRDATAGLARRAAVGAVRRHPAVLVAVLVAVAVVLIVGMVAVATVAAVAGRPPPVADTVAGDIPAAAVAAYFNASQMANDLVAGCSVRPAVIAAIGRVETGHGTFGGASADDDGTVAPPILGVALDGAGPVAAIPDTDDGRLDGDTVWDRAVGPFQFIPGSWELFGVDANGDGTANPHNLTDAAAAAVVHLCGANPTDLDADEEALAAAIYGYNHSDVYVSTVLGHVAAYDVLFADGATVLPDLAAGDPETLTSHPGYSDSAPAHQDLLDGIVDARLIAVLAMLADHEDIVVGGYKTWHSRCIGGESRAQRPDCTESHHYYGRGADIMSVDGRPVTSSNAAARRLVELLAATEWPDPTMRPDDVGSPWGAFDGLPGFFTDASHQDHLHLGMCGQRWRRGTWDPGC